MTNRDRLIELIRQAKKKTKGANCDLEREMLFADYLLANGVIVPPFEIGTKVYVITSATSNGKKLYIFEDTITAYQINMGYRVMCFDNHLGEPHWNWDKVFLTKEEAEQKLKEREG